MRDNYSMFVTQEQRVVVFCHFSAYSEVLTTAASSNSPNSGHENGGDGDADRNKIKTASTTSLGSKPIGKLVRFFPSDGRYEIDGKFSYLFIFLSLIFICHVKWITGKSII